MDIPLFKSQFIKRAQEDGLSEAEALNLYNRHVDRFDNRTLGKVASQLINDYAEAVSTHQSPDWGRQLGVNLGVLE